ncbi:MAG: isocitrate/isopropylmalate dehydrogenase family protein [Coriobacteriia bacterium]|nr:isocitrate/isopropylmalate dehydrogenase family protein [Coriobacteriia bacterium]
MTYRATLIPGDGIGPEITEAMQAVVAAAGIVFDWDVQHAGEAVFETAGEPLPAKVIDAIVQNKLAIKGPTTTPVGTGFRSINVALRKELDLYTNLRPIRSFGAEALRRCPSCPPAEPVDIVIFRENTEDLYAGIEFEAHSDEAAELRACIEKLSGVTIRDCAGKSIKPISEFGSRRIVEAAFDYAIANGRKKVTVVHKANIMKHSDGLFLRVAREVADEYADACAEHGIEVNDVIVDACCMQLVLNPQQFDVMVMPNLYGDIVSDLCAGLVGGLGLAPGANIGKDAAIFEAVHGSAPDIAGLGVANPTALILSAAMMLRHLGETDAAVRIERAIATAIVEGSTLTPDLGGTATTTEYTTTLIRLLDTA